MKLTEYKICTTCIMDNQGDPDITFDANGVCNYCQKYPQFAARQFKGHAKGDGALKQLAQSIKASATNKHYDCLLGVSGGVDSTYTAVLLKDLGLTPLLVHLDNGWNSELAVRNITNLAEKLGFDLYTHVINWEEFRDIQLSFLRASVVDIELVTDYAIVACLYTTAYEKGIKHIISGHNFATEAIMAPSWTHAKSDLKNIVGIHRQFGNGQFKTFPMMSYWQKAWYVQRKKIKITPILNYTNYHKEEAKVVMKERVDWRDYGTKHGESIFTRFYQNYMLPVKFGIDKRKAHLSTLINSGQMTREEALLEMQKPLYEADKLEEDVEYVVKKFGITRKEFEAIMQLPVRQHTDYPSYVTSHYKWEVEWSQRLKPITRPIKKIFGLHVENNYV